MQYELLTQKLKKMDNEKILLDALNTFGNFTSVEQEFNYNQLEVIYEAMNQVLHIAPVVGRSEQLVCDLCDEDGWIRENKGDIIEHRLCKCDKAN